MTLMLIVDRVMQVMRLIRWGLMVRRIVCRSTIRRPFDGDGRGHGRIQMLLLRLIHLDGKDLLLLLILLALIRLQDLLLLLLLLLGCPDDECLV